MLFRSFEFDLKFEDLFLHQEKFLEKDELPNNLLCEELFSTTAEIAEITKKIIRDDNSIISYNSRDKIACKLYIIIGMLFQLCKNYSFDIEEILDKNIEKLYSRKERNVLQGSGDNR